MIQMENRMGDQLGMRPKTKLEAAHLAKLCA